MSDEPDSPDSGPDPAPDGRAPLLELEDVHVYYGAIHALKGLSLQVDSG